jgi:hypothetical protein
MLDLMKRPTAFIPLLISGGFITALLIGFAQGTLVRQPDEGAGAHLFQILMPLQVLIMGVFALSWFQKYPKPTVQVLCLQVSALLAVLAVVYFRHL